MLIGDSFSQLTVETVERWARISGAEFHKPIGAQRELLSQIRIRRAAKKLHGLGQ